MKTELFVSVNCTHIQVTGYPPNQMVSHKITPRCTAECDQDFRSQHNNMLSQMLQSVHETKGSMETKFNLHVGAMVTT